MKTKIIQILPAPAGMTAICETQQIDQQGRAIAVEKPISCLALVEVSDDVGVVYQEVRAMRPMPGTDSLEFAGETDRLIELDHSLSS